MKSVLNINQYQLTLQHCCTDDKFYQCGLKQQNKEILLTFLLALKQVYHRTNKLS
jgi:hypothetical protein